MKLKKVLIFALVLIIILAIPITVFAYPTELNVKKIGAVGDGIADDTAKIQKVINLANDYDHIIIPAGKYKVSQLEISNKHNITISGPGTILKDDTNNVFAIFYIHDTSHITLDGINLIGASGGGSDRGIWALNNSDLQIKNNHFSNFSSQAMIMWGGNTSAEFTNRISNNYITNCGYGIQFIANAEYYAVTNNTITTCKYGIHGALGNDRIDNNQIENNVYGIWMDGSISPNADHSSIAGNQLNHNRAIGLYISNVHLTESIINNEILSTTGPDVWNVTGHYYSLVMINCTNVAISSNQIDGGSDGNIYVDNCSGTRWIGNTINGNIKEVTPCGKNIYIGNVFTGTRKLILHTDTPKPVRVGDIEGGLYITQYN